MAKSEDEVLTTVSAALKHQVPVTTRGAGTGNYGQAMPLRGGIVLDMSGLDQIEHLDAGVLSQPGPNTARHLPQASPDSLKNDTD